MRICRVRLKDTASRSGIQATPAMGRAIAVGNRAYHPPIRISPCLDLAQKSNFILRNGFYSERKQIPGISVRLWKVWANVKPKMYAALPYKQKVRGSSPATAHQELRMFHSAAYRSNP